ncbi:PEP-CTERM sorting domain-containing protein [Nostoc sp. CHAB 5784]|uniref:PEP-CTERM sorting domain-containing protein n=1 Tax=Nostoc mirabile TaxID=2907820 RepID=UPI001E3D0B4C|nr:PEP-CTERM sorting domain-containing protein [Nostoc mirabile]MCC5670020.1 PEP-CTERM sorting domain-containing protein [Nostoc mirabile CHAB5784]
MQEAGGQVPTGRIVKDVVQRIMERTRVPNTYEIGEVCQILIKDNPSLRGKGGCWAIVNQVNDFSCTVKLWDGELTVGLKHLKSYDYLPTGTFTTNDSPNELGFYLISEISGIRNGETITGLQAARTPIPGNEPFEVDNLISLNTVQLTGDGFGYSTSGGNYSSPFFANFLPTPGYLEVFSAPPLVSGFENLGSEDSELPISFSASIITVPEPTSIVSLLALGTFSTHLALKRKKLSKLTDNKLEKVS